MKNSFLFGLLVAFSVNVVAAPAKAPPSAKSPAKGKAKPVKPTWKPATPAQRTAVAKSIRAQLDAFKKDDWEKAATYQSDNLRQMFGTTARFRAAIEGNYPQFADYKAIGFDQARALGPRVEIFIRLTGKDGVKLRALYRMVLEHGIYKIEGVEGGAVVGPGDEGSTFA